MFSINGANIRSSELVIYNRWGEEMFMSSDDINGWDGVFNNAPCQQGVYFYTAVIKGYKSGSTVYANGTFTLLP